MKQNYIISLFSSCTLLLTNDIFYFLNLSIFNTFLIKLSNVYIINFFILVIIISLFLFLISITLNKVWKYNNKLIYFLLESLIIYFIMLFFLIEFNIVSRKIDLSSLLSILFSIIFTSCLYFYSFFYENVVKYKRQ